MINSLTNFSGQYFVLDVQNHCLMISLAHQSLFSPFTRYLSWYISAKTFHVTSFLKLSFTELLPIKQELMFLYDRDKVSFWLIWEIQKCNGKCLPRIKNKP